MYNYQNTTHTLFHLLLSHQLTRSCKEGEQPKLLHQLDLLLAYTLWLKCACFHIVRRK